MKLDPKVSKYAVEFFPELKCILEDDGCICFIFVIPRLTIPQSIIKDKRVKTKYHRKVKDTLRKIIDFNRVRLFLIPFSLSLSNFIY